MRKIAGLLSVISSSILLGQAMQMPAKADDPPSTAPSDTQSDAPTKGAPKHAHGGHERVPARRQVLNLASLTDDQKTKLQGIYDSRKDKFQDLGRQMHELQAAEWQDAQKVLKPEQIDELKSAMPMRGGDGEGPLGGRGFGGGRLGGGRLDQGRPARQGRPQSSSDKDMPAPQDMSSPENANN